MKDAIHAIGFYSSMFVVVAFATFFTLKSCADRIDDTKYSVADLENQNEK